MTPWRPWSPASPRGWGAMTSRGLRSTACGPGARLMRGTNTQRWISYSNHISASRYFILCQCTIKNIKIFFRSLRKEPSFPFHDGGEDHYQDTLGWSCWYTWYCITCCLLSTGIDSVAVICVPVYNYMMLLFQSCINREPKGYIRKSCNLLQGRCQFYVKRFCIYLG